MEAQRFAAQLWNVPHGSPKESIQVAYEMGNSPGIVRQHYNRVVTESKGKLWVPDTMDNVIPLKIANS